MKCTAERRYNTHQLLVDGYMSEKGRLFDPEYYEDCFPELSTTLQSVQKSDMQKVCKIAGMSKGVSSRIQTAYIVCTENPHLVLRKEGNLLRACTTILMYCSPSKGGAMKWNFIAYPGINSAGGPSTEKYMSIADLFNMRNRV